MLNVRKGRSVASVVIKNNQLCATSETTSSSGDPVQNNGDINCYADETIQPLHKKVNGHRPCFDVNENLQTWENSALPKQSYESRQENFDIRNFEYMAYRQGCTTSLNILEAQTINELRLGVVSLNRMKYRKNDFCSFFLII